MTIKHVPTLTMVLETNEYTEDIPIDEMDLPVIPIEYILISLYKWVSVHEHESNVQYDHIMIAHDGNNAIVNISTTTDGSPYNVAGTYVLNYIKMLLMCENSTGIIHDHLIEFHPEFKHMQTEAGKWNDQDQHNPYIAIENTLDRLQSFIKNDDIIESIKGVEGCAMDILLNISGNEHIDMMRDNAISEIEKIKYDLEDPWDVRTNTLIILYNFFDMVYDMDYESLKYTEPQQGL